METQEVSSPAQHARLSVSPEMYEREPACHYALPESDLAAESVRYGDTNRLGFAAQLCVTASSPACSRPRRCEVEARLGRVFVVSRDPRAVLA